MGKKNKQKENNKKVTSIGGQAVLEGVMMRGESSMAIAVRDADGVIRLESNRVKPNRERNFFLRLPVVRGVLSFVQSLFGGTAVLMRSAEVYGEGEPSKFEKWLSEKLKVNIMSVVGTLSVLIALVLAVVLFMWLPQFLRGVIGDLFSIDFNNHVWAKNFIEGGLKLLVFIGYIFFCSLIKDVRRTFMYHGAEHKTISCYERGLELTPENAVKCPRVHDRCGTTFIVFVLTISIVVFACFEAILSVNSVYLSGAVRVVCKLAMLPIVAGLSYELLKALAKTKSRIFYPIKAPGLLLQRLTTKEPDLEMIEVAITAFKKVLEMDADPSMPECKFVVPEKCDQLVARVRDTLAKGGVEEDAEAEWIVSIVSGIKRSELHCDKLISASNVEKIDKLVKERLTGRPLWYCVGDTVFYGATLAVDERVLIPRPETELLVENALKYIKPNDDVLDLCTGSGAIAIAVKLNSQANVYASDISNDALSLARENATKNEARIEFLESDLFDGIADKKFDVIITNPPYVKNDDIKGLQKEVKDFEPRIALDGGDDGLDFYRRIEKSVKDYMKPNCVLLMECGIGQADDIKRIFNDFKVEILKDYEGVERIIKAVL